MRVEQASALRLSLQGTVVGYVVGYQNGRSLFSLDTNYLANEDRLTLSIALNDPDELPKIAAAMPFSTQHRLHPVLSNLLPEGALRGIIAQAMKVHEENEFPLLAYLGRDLPGALVAEPVSSDQLPDSAQRAGTEYKTLILDIPPRSAHFSLAGVQMKFSMGDKDGRYHTSESGELGKWIVKTPSTRHPFLPLNEFTVMRLASLIGVVIPEIRLIETSKIDNLPQINLPDEAFAYGIKRYDRTDEGGRVHSEDFAQVFFEFAHNKYANQNYEQIGRLIYQKTYQGQQDIVQMALRLLANILLGNGDAHIKNWSLLYPDGRNPVLSPAYDIFFTRTYIENESRFALNMNDNKDWYRVDFQHFLRWAERVEVNPKLIIANLKVAMQKARDLWPQALAESPMPDNQKTDLRVHWARLQPDLRILN